MDKLIKLAAAADPAPKSPISGDMNPAHGHQVLAFLAMLGVSDPTLPAGAANSKDFYSDLVRGLLKVLSISPGKVSCSFPVVPAIVNAYKGLNGGVVAIVAERVAVACARTVVAEDKELCMGEVSLSYLSAASMNIELIVESSVLRSGRNITVVSTEFRIKNTRKLVYTSHVTFFHIFPASKL